MELDIISEKYLSLYNGLKSVHEYWLTKAL